LKVESDPPPSPGSVSRGMVPLPPCLPDIFEAGNGGGPVDVWGMLILIMHLVSKHHPEMRAMVLNVDMALGHTGYGSIQTGIPNSSGTHWALGHSSSHTLEGWTGRLRIQVEVPILCGCFPSPELHVAWAAVPNCSPTSLAYH
jgi:hypothetical protein